jgi:hypothetical protein
MLPESVKPMLAELAVFLETDSGVIWAADAVRKALSGSDDELQKFLESNDLWGGSGSIADSAYTDSRSTLDPEEWKKSRNGFLDLMIELGRLQIARGFPNSRTIMWVEAFEHWRQLGI